MTKSHFSGKNKHYKTILEDKFKKYLYDINEGKRVISLFKLKMIYYDN